MSVLMLAFFKSNDITLKPKSLAIVPTEPVPDNNSNKFIYYSYLDFNYSSLKKWCISTSSFSPFSILSMCLLMDLSNTFILVSNIGFYLLLVFVYEFVRIISNENVFTGKFRE